MCRPFDDQDQMRVRLETDAYYLILQAVKDQHYELLVSAVHCVEVEAIKDQIEQEQLQLVLAKFGKPCALDINRAKERSETLVDLGFGIADAAHLACAEQTADVFLTCDDRLLKRCRRERVGVAVVNPVEFCAKEELR